MDFKTNWKLLFEWNNLEVTCWQCKKFAKTNTFNSSYSTQWHETKENDKLIMNTSGME